MNLFRALQKTKFYNFLFKSKAIFRLKEKPHVQIIYLNRRGNIVEPKTAEPFTFDGCILEEETNPRKILHVGNSFAVTFPEGWLNNVTSEGWIKSKLIRNQDGEISIILCKSNGKEVMAS